MKMKKFLALGLSVAMMAGCLAVILVQMQGTQKVAVQEVEDDDF